MIRVALLAALFLALGCAKGEGAVCQSRNECGEGLGCMGESVRRCEPCATWEGCTLAGKCTHRRGLCVVGSSDDCKKSAECTQRAACELLDGACATEAEVRAAAEAANDPRRDRVGCPCGCDRSEAMASELEARGDVSALREVDRSLATIAERERAGFITEAMVQHRLRLLELHERIGGRDPQLGARSPFSPVAHADDPLLVVVGDLVVHGEKTEIVRGRPKLQKASFVWRLRIENRSAQRVAVPSPEVIGSAPFPISRWYVAGTAGAPWNGVVGPREKMVVHAIGYVGKPLAPFTPVTATLRVGSLAISAHTLARDHWDRTTAL